MLINASEKFVLKSIEKTNATNLFDNYHVLIRNNPDRICDKSILYLKAFVQHQPELCLRIIKQRENSYFSLQPYGHEYIHLLTLIAAFYLDKNEVSQGLLWALKAIDLVDYFAPSLEYEKREQILYDMMASSMVCAYPKKINRLMSEQFFLQWEILTSYKSGHYFNDNTLN